ncbi:MAG TPA: Rieske 2Fe-2S domain-containing protein [Chloroflexota bacterium]|nr:Rieske 2Fe-2S domain-containing protein [Chloroflexota bacterium]
MLSQAENELLTRTNAGTPMGELFRRFWIPALLPSELPGPDSDPVRLRLLGEDLIAFRDSNGKVGVLANNCPHRGASLFFGRNEESGLRCVYHGWKFDTTGQCVDMPNQPAESDFRTKVAATAYAAADWGGLIWVYMGPSDRQPELPQYPWCLLPRATETPIAKWIQSSNYSQGLEGNLDTSHINFLHRAFNRPVNTRSNSAPMRLIVLQTPFGFVYGAKRQALEDGRYHWRLTTFAYPTFTAIPGSKLGGNFFVIPRDDESSWWFMIHPKLDDAPQPELDLASRDPYGLLLYGGPKKADLQHEPNSWRLARNGDNDYLIDRDMQRQVNYTGLPTNRVQDAAVTESMGKIYDRTQEHLGAADTAIIQMRRHLIQLAEQLQQGKEPDLAQHPSWFRQAPLEVVSAEENLESLWEKHHAEFLAEFNAPTASAVSRA